MNFESVLVYVILKFTSIYSNISSFHIKFLLWCMTGFFLFTGLNIKLDLVVVVFLHLKIFY